MASHVSKKPSGYFITINAEVLESAGKDGMIADEATAKTLWRVLTSQYPDKTVLLFTVYMVAGLKGSAA